MLQVDRYPLGLGLAPLELAGQFGIFADQPGNDMIGRALNMALSS